MTGPANNDAALVREAQLRAKELRDAIAGSTGARRVVLDDDSSLLEGLAAALAAAAERADQYADRGDFLVYRKEWDGLIQRAERAEATVTRLRATLTRFAEGRHTDRAGMSIARAALAQDAEAKE